MTQIDVCKFHIPSNKEKESLSVLQFFHKKDLSKEKRIQPVVAYRLHLVSKGNGILKLPTREIPISNGDLFLTFPATKYSFPLTEDLEYYCITFVNLHGNELLERAELDAERCHIRNVNALIPQWELFFSNTHAQNIDLIAESLLLYTFGYICKKTHADKSHPTKKYALELKAFADAHFQKADINLKSFCHDHGYNRTYILSAFKKYMGVTFGSYVNALRMSHAEFLLRNGETSIKKVSAECGFRTPRYFSAVFKKEYDVSPKEFIANLKKSSTTG